MKLGNFLLHPHRWTGNLRAALGFPCVSRTERERSRSGTLVADLVEADSVAAFVDVAVAVVVDGVFELRRAGVGTVPAVVTVAFGFGIAVTVIVDGVLFRGVVPFITLDDFREGDAAAREEEGENSVTHDGLLKLQD